MRKFLIASLAALVAVSGLAVIAHATNGRQHTSWNFKFTTKVKKTSTGTDSLVKPSLRDDKGTPDKSDDSYDAAAKNVVLFPKGAKFDNTAAPICKDSPSKFAQTRGSNCSRTIVGSGKAVSVVGDGAQRQTLASTLKAYNKADGFWFVIQPCAVGSGPDQPVRECTPVGNPIILDAKMTFADSRRTQRKLTVITPKSLLDNNVIIDTFQLVTKKITKSTKNYTTTPPTCLGTWESQIQITYKSGAKQTIKHKAPCRR